MTARPSPDLPSSIDAVVVGGGQAGVALSRELTRRGVDHVVLDDNPDGPGGAWTRTWPSLTLFSPASASSLPGRQVRPVDGDGFPPASHVVDYLAGYEDRYGLPVVRPVRVREVLPDGDRLLVRTDAGDVRARVVASATGTWSRPYVPHYPGMRDFGGRMLHSAHYRGPAEFAGLRVAVVGGANSAAQIAADLRDDASRVHWLARRPVTYLPDDVDGRDLFLRATRKRAGGDDDWSGELEGDVVAVPPVRAARDAGWLRAEPMVDRFIAGGAMRDDENLPLDAVIWCTGFRPAVGHLRAFGVRGREADVDGGPETGWRSAADPRLFPVGYGDWTGPASATLIGVAQTVGPTADAMVRQLAD
ncbi:NAD(P)-binding domain-containing protein [Corynebacterium sp. 335C]